MRRIRRPSHATVVAYVALFVALSGGTAVALSGSNTVFTDDIANDTRPASGGNPAGGLVAADLRPSSVGTSEVANGSLNDEDIGQGTFVNFTGAIGIVPAHECVEKAVTGVNAQGDHLVLTPDHATLRSTLVYSAESSGQGENMYIQVCNPTAQAKDDGNTNFNLLVIDAQ